MGHSIYSADRSTHLKIVALALLIVIAGLSLFLHSYPTDPTNETAALRAGTPMAVSSSSASVVR